MPTPLPVNLFRINVTFDVVNKELSFSGPDIGEDRMIYVPQGIAMLSFHLVTTGNSSPSTDAAFQSVPIQWFEEDGKTPMPQPGAYTVQWFKPNHFSVIIFNSAIDENKHLFNVIVTYDGNTYGSDPTIVTQPPDGTS